MELRPVGITGIMCVLGSQISPETGARVSALDEAVRSAGLPGLVETVPSYTSLLVRYDPLTADFDSLAARLRALEEGLSGAAERLPRVVELPVCYGGELGPDLPDVAAHAGLTEEEVIRLHSERTYRIYMLGFLPGFPYLGGLDERLATPRLAVPRTRIPAGSVGIGGSQTGVYPIASPGGWRLIGRTPVRLFDPGRPLPYRAGDLIRFVPITLDAFRREEASACPC